jgi:glutathione S-transferase
MFSIVTVMLTQHFLFCRAASKLAYLNDNVFNDGKQFMVGDKFTIADSYLYIVLSWAQYVGVDTAPYPNVIAFSERVAALPFVQAAHARMASNPSSVL